MRLSAKGFTIAELTVAVAIIALLLFGAMIPFSAQVEIRNVAETRRTLDSIKEAIIGYAQANGRLPCPANGNVAFGTAGAGAEQFNGTNCVAALGGGAFGVVPWVTLGTPETDAWGRRFSYRVSPAFADAVLLPTPPNPPGTPNPTWNTLANPYAPAAPKLAQPVAPPASPQDQAPYCDLTVALVQSSFALCTLGDITVFTRNSAGGPAVPLAVAIPVVVVSHGKNGFGAWQPNGTQLPVAPPGSDEAANASGNTTATPAGGYLNWAFYSRSPTSEFDDIVISISASTLIARVVAAGRLP